MKDILDILDWQRRADTDTQNRVLATVVKTVGASYRRPGARMLSEASIRIKRVRCGCDHSVTSGRAIPSTSSASANTRNASSSGS